MLVAVSVIFIGLGYLFSDANLGILLFLAAQVSLLAIHLRSGHVNGTGAFIFMSVLFFGIRPLYIVLENDHSLFLGLFRITADFSMIHENMGIATVGLLVFHLGSHWVKLVGNKAYERRKARTAQVINPVSAQMAQFILTYQILSLPVMVYLARAGRALYGSAFGAYAYDLPVPIQAGHIFGFVVLLERWRQNPRLNELIPVFISGILFLVFTWLMREVSMFRGFYIAGVMIVGIAALDRLKPRVSFLWLILPIVLLQPLFQILGNTRELDNASLREKDLIEEAFGKQGFWESYWGFYSSKGDMNIFDTFIAARASTPDIKPYVASWIYAPFHVVPRKIWKGKPERGLLHDINFMNGAPYCPGIAGFFWLDGASDLWMLGNLLVLGALIGYLDRYVLSMRNSYLSACLLGILVVNAMFLTRFFLWQALWQTIYAVVPCIILQRLLAPRSIIVPIDPEDQIEEPEPTPQQPAPNFRFPSKYSES